MGVKIELNWYLVVDTKNAISKTENGMYFFGKEELRQYPIGGIFPLLTKDKSYTALVRVEKVTQHKEYTEVYFTNVDEVTLTQEVIDHYYELYYLMKN